MLPCNGREYCVIAMNTPLDPELLPQKKFLSYRIRNAMVLIDSVHYIDICLYFMLYVYRIKLSVSAGNTVFLDDI